MQPKFDLATVLPNLIEWCETHAVRLGVLFGSQATGAAHAHSDVDLAVWPATKTGPDYLRWLRELETLFDLEINLVIVSADLDPVLGMEIVRHGQLLYEREPGMWAHHRLQLWHAYNDSLPFRRKAQQSLRQFAEEVRARLDDKDAA